MTPTLLPTAERRSITTAAARPQLVRAAADDGQRRFVGHAAVFNQRTLIGRLPWGFYEEFAPGAFTDTIADGGESLGVDQAKLIDHASYYVVSRVGAGTLRLAEDKTGLAVDSDLNERLSYVADLITNLEVGNITGMSIGFYVDEDDWSIESIDVPGVGKIEIETRTVIRASLLEVSSVTFPAFTQTDAGLRDVAAALRHRGDPAAYARYAERSAELRGLLDTTPIPPRPAPQPAPAPRTAAARARHADALAARYRL